MVPDAKTIWKFREELTKAELIKPLFAKFDEYLAANGFEAQGGQLIGWNFFGYKNHANVDEGSKIIRDYDVSPANTHDGQKLEGIVTAGGGTAEPSGETSCTEGGDIPKVYADKAYDSDKIDAFLRSAGLGSQICRRARRGAPLSEQQKKENLKRSRIR
jgi:IS5 family transposase